MQDGKANMRNAEMLQEQFYANATETITDDIENELTADQLQVRFSVLRKINPECVGWLHIDGTNISCPIVKASDNAFYLNHDFQKEQNSHGAIFMDARNAEKMTDANTVIYGHNMKDGTMFHDLQKYKNELFCKENSDITVYTLEGEAHYKIFSVYVGRADNQLLQLDFETQQHFEAYIDSMLKQSICDMGISISSEDTFITLTTCSYENEDARMLIHAVKETEAFEAANLRD